MMGVSGQANVSAVGVGLLGLGVVGSAVAKALLSRDQSKAVSYTHLTLPTKRIV